MIGSRDIVIVSKASVNDARTSLYGCYQFIANANRQDRLNTLLNMNGYFFNT